MSIWSLYPQICFIIWFHFFSNAGVNTISSAGISVRSKKFKSSQRDINLIMSHINSTPRQSLGGLSPMALAKIMLPHELLNFFDLTEIQADEIVLTPALLKK